MRQCWQRGQTSLLNTIRSRASWPVALRYHASTQTRRCLHVGTVTAGTLDEALKKLPQGQSAEEQLALLLLVTPGYARAAKDGSLPVNFATAAFGKPPKILESVTAVIDSISSKQDGCPTEGIAYAACSRKSLPMLLTSTQLRSAANKPGSLTFQFEATKAQWDIQLPLAQTIFSTGLTSTLIHRMHEQSPEKDQPQLVAERFLESLTFRVPSEKPAQVQVEQLPLLPLTGCQIVQNVMGNIIRTVKPLGSDAIEEPASTGLEKAVTAYFVARDAAPEPVSVWVLIIPKHIMAQKQSSELTDILSSSDKLQRTWTSVAEQKQRKQQYADVLVQLLQSGGRLVRVLSGGGGWGKKAGLLSLDPDLEYTTRELRDDFGWSFDFDGDDVGKSTEASLDQALGKSVEVGDGLIFMIAHQEDTSISSESTEASFRLGMCMPEDSDPKSEEGPILSKVSDKLAAFSESGMAIKTTRDGKLGSASKLEVPGLSVTVR